MKFSMEDARKAGDVIGIDWGKYNLEQFMLGMNIELEHGTRDSETNVTDDDAVMTGKIAFAHLKELPDYYDRLKKMEEDIEKFWRT